MAATGRRVDFISFHPTIDYFWTVTENVYKAIIQLKIFMPLFVTLHHENNVIHLIGNQHHLTEYVIAWWTRTRGLLDPGCSGIATA